MKEEKIKNIDFVIQETKYDKTIFRFLPRQSSCHSFGDDPPTKWSEVYKVYYSYKVIIECDDGDIKTVYDSGCDECSIIDAVAYSCQLLSEGKREIAKTYDGETRTIKLLDHEILPSGYGVLWTIREAWNENFCFELFNWNNVGYRFFLGKERLKEFGDYLEGCCEYMLAHGDPI